MSAHSLNSACLFRLLRAALIFESTTPCVGTGLQLSPVAWLEAAAGFSSPVPSWLGSAWWNGFRLGMGVFGREGERARG